MMQNEAKRTFWQFVKFNLIGLTNTLVDFVVFWVLTHFGMNYLVAQIFSYSAGIANSYIWNSLWTFRKERSHTPRTILLFLLVNLVSLGVSLGVLWICKNPLQINQDWVFQLFGREWTIGSDLICKLPASFFSAMANFAGNKLFVFNKVTDGSAEDKKPDK